MRRWHLLDRLFHAPDPFAWDRYVPIVEELERREVLSPVVSAPNFFTPETPEGTTFTFGGSASFFAFDQADSGQLYTAELSATNGTVTVDEFVAASLAVSVADNGTATVTLTGRLNDINSLLVSGIDYGPTAFYSGEAQVGLNVTDSATGDNGADSVRIRVTPVASPAELSVNAFDEVRALSSSGFVFPPSFVSITSWPDADGSETATITLQLFAPNAGEFVLSADGVVLTPVGAGEWEVDASTEAELQSLFDSLVLTPPAGFTGRAQLQVFGTLTDSAEYPSFESSETDTNEFLGFGFAELRFFLGGNVTLPTVTVPEGGTMDLGGRFDATDPDELFGDSHVLTLAVPGGLFTFTESALVPGMSADREVAGDGSTTITLNGDLTAINQFLATAGSLLYSAPDPDFSGVIPITITLANIPGEPFEPSENESPAESSFPSFAPLVQLQPGSGSGSEEAPGKFTGVGSLVFSPVAGSVFPSAQDAVTNQDTPVAVFIEFAPVPTDPSESVLVLIEGVPAGASFNHGSDIGEGTWALSPADLDGLIFTPPPGEIGEFSFVVTVIVTDSDPANETSDSSTASTSFIVTVLPIPAPVPPDPVPNPTSAPDPIPDPVPDPVPPPPVVLNLPPNVVTGVGGSVVVGSSARVGEPVAGAGGTATDQSAGVVNAPILPEAFVFAPPVESVFGTVESRPGLQAPVLGSLFPQPEIPLPTYGGDEKHPLPPVLPLDQTSPIAAFTESGGDSFALVDKLYRDAAAQTLTPAPGTVTVAPTPTAVPVAGAAPQPAKERPVAAAQPDSESAAGAAPNTDDSTTGEWGVWVAGSAIAGALAAWVWMSRTPNSFLTRAARRLLHPARRPTERPA